MNTQTRNTFLLCVMGLLAAAVVLLNGPQPLDIGNVYNQVVSGSVFKL